MFSVKNIGNQLITARGSLDYGIYHLKTPILLIMGHTYCGAIKGALSNYEHESYEIIDELDHLHIPLANLISKSESPAHDVFEKLWIEGTQKNVDFQVEKALKRYNDLVQSGKLTIIGTVYDFANWSGFGAGRLIIVNINGESRLQSLHHHPVLKKIPAQLLQRAVHRYPTKTP